MSTRGQESIKEEHSLLGRPVVGFELLGFSPASDVENQIVARIGHLNPPAK